MEILGAQNSQNNLGTKLEDLYFQISNITVRLQQSIYYSTRIKVNVCMPSHFSCVPRFVTLWTVALRLLCPWDSPGKNTGMGCHALLQGIFPIYGSTPHLLGLGRSPRGGHATHSINLAWRIPWTEGPVRLWSIKN